MITAFCIEVRVLFYILSFCSITYFFRLLPRFSISVFLLTGYWICLFSKSSCKAYIFYIISGLQKLSKSWRTVFWLFSFICFYYYLFSTIFNLNLSCFKMMPQLFFTSSPKTSSLNISFWFSVSFSPLYFYISFIYYFLDDLPWCFLSAYSN